MWACCVWGCAGNAPLLYTAHPLSEGKISVSGGFSASFAGAFSRPAATGEGAAVVTSIADNPGVSPWVAARVGLPSSTDVGIACSGSGVHADARHAFLTGHVAFSVGTRLHARLSHGRDDNELDRSTTVHTQSHGLGLDVPLLLGWQSPGGIVALWGGAILGYEQMRGAISEGGSPTESDFSLGDRTIGAATGLSVGFRHIHALVELQGTQHFVDGTVAGKAESGRGLSWTPAAALQIGF